MVTRGPILLQNAQRKHLLGGKYGGRGVYEALSVCGQYYDSVMVGGGLHSWNKLLVKLAGMSECLYV